ncbi:o-succinylbenzoate synthase [Corynebacterium sp. CCM 8862]|uniref:o-succinylbenzoate synthase n=2 Tax=Corynebacterium mendelii TaxID=2765362 RepID=A0A939DZH6_9CORY|nr:o-succinylbenzoate synthase [Corynebacterium mendelii]
MLGVDRRLADVVHGLDPYELVAGAHVVSLPMRVRFRGITTREAVLVRGPAGWGEFSPFPEYPPAEAAAWLASAVEAAYVGLPEPGAAAVPVNGTIPAVAADRVAAVVERCGECTTFKIKVAEKNQSLADDIARVERVRRLRPGAAIRVDANGGWTVAQAVDAACRLGELDYIEQPCASAGELAEVKQQLLQRGIATRIAADESVRRADDPLAVIAAGAVDAVVLKVAPLGGVRRMVAIARKAHAAGMTVTVASALDTAVGITGGLVAASLLPARAAGVGTGWLLADDVAPARVSAGGMLACDTAEPDPAALARCAAPPERHKWWMNHLMASARALRAALG